MDVGGTLPLESSTCPNYFSLKATLSQMSNVTDFVGFKLQFERTFQAQASCRESCGCHSTLIGALQAAPEGYHEKLLHPSILPVRFIGIKDSTIIHYIN